MYAKIQPLRELDLMVPPRPDLEDLRRVTDCKPEGFTDVDALLLCLRLPVRDYVSQ